MSIAIIDLDPVLHIVANVQWAAGNRTDFKRVRDHTTQFVNNVIKSANTEQYIMFFQDDGHKNFRNGILPDYKGNRIKQEAIIAFKTTVCDALKALGAIPLYNIESDDALSLYALACRKKGIDTLIVENDKDLAMIAGAHYNPYKRQPKNKPPIVRWYSYSDEEAFLSFWIQVMTGDATDMPNNQCGIFKCGPAGAKKAYATTVPEAYYLKCVQEYVAKYGVANGLKRMSITYDLVKLLRNEQEELPETKMVLASTPIGFTDSVSALFDNKEESNNLFK